MRGHTHVATRAIEASAELNPDLVAAARALQAERPRAPRGEASTEVPSGGRKNRAPNLKASAAVLASISQHRIGSSPGPHIHP